MQNKMGNIKNEFFDRALAELDDTFGELVILKRWTSSGTPGPDGYKPPDNYQLIPTRAVIDDIGIEAIKSSNGTLAAGDLKFEIRIRPQEAGTAPYYGGDLIAYEGVDYWLLTKPMTEYLGGKLYYTCIARRKSDA